MCVCVCVCVCVYVWAKRMCSLFRKMFFWFSDHLFPQTTMKAFKKADFSVVREHEEFIWLHDHFIGNEELAGFIVGFHGNHISLVTNSVCSLGPRSHHHLLGQTLMSQGQSWLGWEKASDSSCYHQPVSCLVCGWGSMWLFVSVGGLMQTCWHCVQSVYSAIHPWWAHTNCGFMIACRLIACKLPVLVLWIAFGGSDCTEAVCL